MNKKCEMQEEQYRKMLLGLWGRAWYCGDFSGKYKPKPDDFFFYMKALIKHIDMLEKRIEELEKTKIISSKI